MRGAIYNPYLDSLGGGERYTMAFAKVLANLGYDIDVQWQDEKIAHKLEERFGEKLPKNINFVSDVKRGDGYDLIFWISDGSIPTLRARKNFLHFQVPFKGVGGNSLLNKMKLFRVDKIICNSEFTKKVIDREYGVESVVVYPPVDTIRIKPKRKENIILFVGRFSEILQSKGQEILVKEFKKYFDRGNSEWKLVLAGGAEVGVDKILNNIKKSSIGYPIEILISPNFSTLKDLYGKAKIFWSASGFGIDEEKMPQRVEHFGITLVEAMAGGAVPVAYCAGGHKEIVTNGTNGYLWEKISELHKYTKITRSNLRYLSKSAQESSKKFSYENFEKNIKELL